MDFKDILLPAPQLPMSSWQFGHKITGEIQEDALVLVFVSDYRGAGGNCHNLDFEPVRRQLYQLSALDFEVPVCDLGDLISGRSLEDTHYILQEVIAACLHRGALPIVIGGDISLSAALFSALAPMSGGVNLLQISPVINLNNEGEGLSEDNFLAKILGAKTGLRHYRHLGYQKFLNSTESVRLMEEVGCDVVRLAEMAGGTERWEPLFRDAHLVAVNCDAVEALSEAFSQNPQVNGLNRREVCAYMKEVGMSPQLRAAGIFNYNPLAESPQNHQLLAQMIWHIAEGLNILRSHPRESTFETYRVLVGEQPYTFKKETFTNLWYFGEDEDVRNCIPCAPADYEAAKKGALNRRFFR